MVKEYTINVQSLNHSDSYTLDSTGIVSAISMAVSWFNSKYPEIASAVQAETTVAEIGDTESPVK